MQISISNVIGSVGYNWPNVVTSRYVTRVSSTGGYIEAPACVKQKLSN